MVQIMLTIAVPPHETPETLISKVNQIRIFLFQMRLPIKSFPKPAEAQKKKKNKRVIKFNLEQPNTTKHNR